MCIIPAGSSWRCMVSLSPFIEPRNCRSANHLRRNGRHQENFRVCLRIT